MGFPWAMHSWKPIQIPFDTLGIDSNWIIKKLETNSDSL